jgi:hypothetical protein
MTIAPAMPCAIRASTSVVGLGASPQAADATVNRPSPIVYTRRRPSSSPSRPAVMRNAANDRP